MKKIVGSGLVLVVAFLLSGCTLPTGNTEVSISTMTGGMIRSDDRGQAYKPIVKVDDKKNIAKVNVLSLGMDYMDTKKIYLGSLESGVFMTKDGGETWAQVNVPIQKNYAIATHPSDSNIAYVTGVFNGRAKIAKTIDGGETWKETYTEPADGTVLLSLALKKSVPDVVYAGTSTGVIIMTQDGGATWENKFNAGKPVRALSVDPFNESIVYVMTFQNSLLMSRDGGNTFVDMKEEWKKALDEKKKACVQGKECAVKDVVVGSVYSYSLDRKLQGVGYVGTNKGLFRFSGYGANWEEINIIGSSKAFPIASVVVSPENSSEIYYNSAQAIYRTTDGGVNWFPYQLDADKASVSVMIHDFKNPGIIYVGLRESAKQ